MLISIDFRTPVGTYPMEAMDWNTGSPFDLSRFYPATAGLLFLGRDQGCAHTRYWIDGGLILELEATAINQAFGLFVAKPAGSTNTIRIAAVFDFVESLKREVLTSSRRRKTTIPFIGSIGAIANDADVATGLTAANRRIGATCVLNYDPDALPTSPPSAPPSVQRFRLNAPGSMYSKPRPENPFHQFEFLRAPLSPRPRPASQEFALEVTASAAASPNFATAWMRLAGMPAKFGPDGGPTKIATSSIFRDFSTITYAGVALAITDTSTTWLQPSMGPLRARIKSLEVDFS